MRKYSIVALTLVFFTLALATVAMAVDPFVGTWKLNLAKSKFNPPSSALKSDMVKIEAQDNGLKFTFDRVDVEGKAIHIEEAPKFDGKDYPVKGVTTVDTVSLRRIDANTFEHVEKKDGKEGARVLVVVSKNGRTSTVTSKEKNEKGQDVTSIVFYDKQ
jgi:hypothetical protein